MNAVAHPCARYARPRSALLKNVLVRVGFGISQPTVEVRDPGHWNPVPQVGVHRRLVYWRLPARRVPTQRGGRSWW